MRKLFAQRHNERVRLVANSFNLLGLGVLAPALLPILLGADSDLPQHVFVGLIALAAFFHLGAHGMFWFLKDEE